MKLVRNIVLQMLLMIPAFVYATHERAGEITYTHISGLTYEIKIVTFTYTPSPANRPELTVQWGDGSSSVIPRTEVVQFPDLIQRNVYTGLAARHTFPGPGSYLITLEDPNRNYGVLNIPNSVNVPFYVQSLLVINSFLGPNNSPELLIPPIDVGCVDYDYIHNPGAYDIDGDSLSYKLVPCRGNGGQFIPGFVLPNEVDPLPGRTFELDPVSGELKWSSPSLQGEYNFSFIIEEWRSNTLVGYVTRDMQVNIVACDNNPPQISLTTDTCIRIGDTLNFKVVATDPDNDIITLTGSGQPLLFEQNEATFEQPVDSTGRVTSYFSWAPSCEQVRNQPYQMFFKAIDHGIPVRLTDIEVCNIRLIAPPPEGLTVVPSGTHFNISWNITACDNAKGYRLYRKQGGLGVDADYCQSGLPPNSGYVLVFQSNTISETAFLDDNNGHGLINGNSYCYLVTTYFNDGAESYIPEEVCASLKKDVPIITNVSVVNTSDVSGAIYVAWSKPTEFDTIEFPGPYQYIISRSESSSGNFQQISILPSINDTIFNDQGIDTKNELYYYRIEFYDISGVSPVNAGTSAPASSVFLNIQPIDNELILEFNPDVPWVNQRYDVFRYNNQTQIFDSIGFSNTNRYVDSGLENGTIYRYFVRSSGEYSISGISNPLLNNSQINQGTPLDNIPPCPPILSVETDCELSLNTLKWNMPIDTCPFDINHYRVYFSASEQEILQLLATVSNPFDTTFVHGPLTFIAACYTVSAVDSIGNESAMSNKVCVDIDSCSLYSLPNVFTPNGDTYNDLFRPFPFTSVEKIELKVFNRWGRLVFETTDPQINWDGKCSGTNQPCPDGAYFVSCEVYELRLSGVQRRTITTSVTIIR